LQRLDATVMLSKGVGLNPPPILLDSSGQPPEEVAIVYHEWESDEEASRFYRFRLVYDSIANPDDYVGVTVVEYPNSSVTGSLQVGDLTFDVDCGTFDLRVFQLIQHWEDFMSPTVTLTAKRSRGFRYVS
jgi:hypothetical protein